jgi:BirA family biotin operon repressor/biotin-[acetyl-CoA-carboxylase] ligase
VREKLSITELVSVDSTNAYLMQRSLNVHPGTTVFTMNQSAGRGRLGRQWVGAPGETLAVSCVVGELPAGVSATWLPLLAGACAHTVLVAIGCHGTSVKWPNDIVLGGKKLSGILVEQTPGGSFVVGMGLNVSNHPHSIDTATSLATQGITISDIAEDVVRPWVQCLLTTLEESVLSSPAHVIDSWRTMVGKSLGTLGKRVVVQTTPGASVEGVATALDDDGALIVRSEVDGHTVVIHSGDVFHIERS